MPPARPTGEPVGRPSRRRWIAIGLVAVWSIALVGGTVWILGRHGESDDPSAGPVSSASGATVPAASLPTTVPVTGSPSAPVTQPAAVPPATVPEVTTPAVTVPVATEPAPATTVPRPSGTPAWRIPTTGDDLLPPVSAGATALVGSLDGTVRGVDPVSGAARWTGEFATDFPAFPSAVGNDAFVVAGPGLVGVDPATGRIRWTLVTDGFNAFPSDPVAAGDLVVTATDVAVYAVEPTTGTVRWTTSDDGGMFTGSPTVAGDVVVVPTSTGLSAFDASDGSRRWTFATGDLEGVWSRPAVANGRVLVTTGARLVAIDAATGALLWSFTPDDGDQLNESPAVAEDTVFVTDGRVYALDVATGTVRWRSDAVDAASSPAVSSTPVPAGDLLLVPTSDGLSALALETGALRWRFAVDADLGVGVPAVRGDEVVVLSISLDASAAHGLDLATGSERWRIPIAGEAHVGPPLIAGELILLPGRTEIVAVW